MIIKVLDVTYDVTEAVDYYNTVNTVEYQSLTWFAKDESNNDLSISKVRGWAIQYPNNHISGPYNMAWGWDILDPKLYRNSEIAFGFSKKILTIFPLAVRAFIYVNPPGTHFQPHIDTTKVFRIHIPIISNPDASWITEEGITNMIPGNAYLVDTSFTHETINAGTSDRVHIELEMRREDIHTISNLSIRI